MDRSILEAALIGLGHKMGEVTLKIAEIKRVHGGAEAGTQTQGTRRTMSAAARTRIAAAQRKRWAAQKKQSGQTAQGKQPSPKKPRISPAARKRMSDCGSRKLDLSARPRDGRSSDPAHADCRVLRNAVIRMLWRSGCCQSTSSRSTRTAIGETAPPINRQ